VFNNVDLYSTKRLAYSSSDADPSRPQALKCIRSLCRPTSRLKIVSPGADRASLFIHPSQKGVHACLVSTS
jgi:hypothetical protein